MHISTPEETKTRKNALQDNNSMHAKPPNLRVRSIGHSGGSVIVDVIQLRKEHMGIEIFATYIDWDQIEKSGIPSPTEDDVPSAAYLDEKPYCDVYFSQDYQVAFNLAYDIVREEMTAKQRDVADQFYRIVNLWLGKEDSNNIYEECECSENNSTDWPSDIALNQHETRSYAFYSPARMKELARLMSEIDFDEIERLIRLLDPVPNETRSEIDISKFRNQKMLEIYADDPSFRFYSIENAVEFATQFVKSISIAAENGYGFQISASD